MLVRGMSDIDDNRFCFLAIVRDEAPIIERCLTSIKDIATSYLVCDTGSVDNTPNIVTSFMAKYGIPGEVIYREWVSYGETKSELLKAFREHPLVGKAKYICWLDADEVFITVKKDPTSYPDTEYTKRLYTYLEQRSEDIFRVPTIYQELEYPRWQIARNNQLYMWVLPYQEYFEGTTSNSTHDITIPLWNLSRHEGHSSRDPEITKKRIAMAEKWMDQNPDNPGISRMNFYLADAYTGIDNVKAIELYRKRLRDMRGYYQERYISMLKLARLLPDIGSKLYYWNLAQEMIPDRLEAYYDMFMFYYNQKNYKKAIGIFTMAPVSRVPPTDALFTRRDVYDYLFDINASDSYSKLGKHKKAYTLGSEVLARKLYPEPLKEIVENNLKYFATKYIPIAKRYITTTEVDRSDISHALPRAKVDALPVIIVIDNFYEDPTHIRSEALKMDFSVKGNYPGTRTQPFASNDIKERFEGIVGRKITYWPEQYNGSYQYTTVSQKSWIHRDKTDYSVVVYLTPDAPVNGGTVLYRHILSGLERTSTDQQEVDLNNDGNNESLWEVVDRIGNKFNRAIIFQGYISHKSDTYFGEDLYTGRLFQTFFFNVEGRVF